MGALSRIGLDFLVQAHALDAFVETGTGHGHNLITALQWPELKDLRSIEIDEQTWHRNVVTFSNEPRVRLYHGDSPNVLPGIAVEMNALDRRVLWFLDAHYPGSGRLVPLPMVPTPSPLAAVPLSREFAALVAHRDLRRDVLVIDDLCLFEAGEYESDAPQLRANLGLGSLWWVESQLCGTHEITRVMRDGGYMIAKPKERA